MTHIKSPMFMACQVLGILGLIVIVLLAIEAVYIWQLYDFSADAWVMNDCVEQGGRWSAEAQSCAQAVR